MKNLIRCATSASMLPILLVVFASPLEAQPAATADSEEWVQAYEPRSEGDMPYRLMRPRHYSASEIYPVIVSLHGGGGRGTDNRKQLRGWNRLLAEDTRRSAHPSYVLAPQATGLWGADHLKKIKSIISGLPSADMDRIYLLGHSMGGHGSFILLQLDPDYFAAAAPSAGTGLPETAPFIDASLIRDIPIWAFHGDLDTVAPYERGRALFEEMQKLEGNFKMTTWNGDAHSVATKMVTGGVNGQTRCSSQRCDPESDLLAWLFRQSLSARR